MRTHATVSDLEKWRFWSICWHVWPPAMLKGKQLTFLNCRGSSSSWNRVYFCPSFFLRTRSCRLFLQTRGCCTYAAANTQEQEATVSMKVHEMEADSAMGKQYFGWSSFWWPIRPRCLYDLPLPLPAFMCLGPLCGTQWPLIKDWAKALRRPWRHSYQMPHSSELSNTTWNQWLYSLKHCQNQRQTWFWIF